MERPLFSALRPNPSIEFKHGESQFNVEGKIGGDSLLSPRGMQYADALPDLITDNIGDAPLTVGSFSVFRSCFRMSHS